MGVMQSDMGIAQKEPKKNKGSKVQILTQSDSSGTAPMPRGTSAEEP